MNNRKHFKTVLKYNETEKISYFVLEEDGEYKEVCEQDFKGIETYYIIYATRIINKIIFDDAILHHLFINMSVSNDKSMDISAFKVAFASYILTEK